MSCKSCKTNEVSKNGFYCENCWQHLLPDKFNKDSIQWGDIWFMLCHWYSLHNESNKDYELVHGIVTKCMGDNYRAGKI